MKRLMYLVGAALFGLLGFAVALVMSSRVERVVCGTVERVEYGLDKPSFVAQARNYVDGTLYLGTPTTVIVVRTDSGELVNVDIRVDLPPFVFPRKKCELHLRDRMWSSPMVTAFELK